MKRNPDFLADVPLVIPGDDHRKHPKHLAWIREQWCCVPGCGTYPVVAHHVREGQTGGTGMKPHDKYCVSLCDFHHKAVHRGPKSFAAKYGINLAEIAQSFAARSPFKEGWK